MTEVYHEGTLLTTTISAEYSKSFENEADGAEFELVDFNEVDPIDVSDEIEVREEGNTVWSGIVTQIPNTIQDSRTFTIQAEQLYGDLLDMSTNGRVFYQTNRSEVARKLVTEQVENRGIEITETFSDLSNTTSNAPTVELGDFQSNRPEKFGSNLAYIGFPVDETTDSTYSITVSNIDYSGDEFTQLQVELLLNNLGSVFNITAQYVDADQKNYVWDVGSPDGYSTLLLDAAEANDRELTNGLTETDTKTLKIFVNLSGFPVESRAIGLDAVKVTSNTVSARDTKYTTNIPTENTTVSRKFQNSVSEAIYSLYQGSNKKVIIEDDSKTLTVRSERDTEAPYNIDSTTPVLDFGVNTDSNKVINKAVVEGDNKTFSESQNIESQTKYGQKVKRVRDTSIKSQDDASTKANEIVENNSYTDTIFEVEVPTTQETRNTKTGQAMSVNIYNINTIMTVKEKQVNEGRTTFILEGKSKNLN
jgi:hypothetical protein